MITTTILQTARARPDKTAVVNSDIPMSYATFARALGVTRNFFALRGLPVGRTAAILIPDLMIGWLVSLALRDLGLTTVCVKLVEQIRLLGLNDTVCLVASPAQREELDLADEPLPGVRLITVPESIYKDVHFGELPSPRDGRRPFGGHILYTSGTTGSHKKVLHDPAHEDKRLAIFAAFLGFNERTVYNATNFALWTSIGQRGAAAAWHVGGSVVLDQRPDYLDHLANRGTTHAVLLTPSIGSFLQARQASPPQRTTLEIFTGGSGGLSVELAEKVAALDRTRLTILYASTECGSIMRSHFRTADDLIWLQPDPARTIQVVDENGNQCPAGEQGELRILTTEVDCTSYLDDEEASAKVFRDGFFYPGDLATRRADGRIRILGRVADVLLIEGQKVAVAPMEEKVQERLQAAAVCLFATQADDGCYDLTVAVESDRALTAEEQDWLVRIFPWFTRVRAAVFPEFPRGEGVRKIRRLELRNLATARATPIGRAR